MAWFLLLLTLALKSTTWIIIDNAHLFLSEKFQPWKLVAVYLIWFCVERDYCSVLVSIHKEMSTMIMGKNAMVWKLYA